MIKPNETEPASGRYTACVTWDPDNLSRAHTVRSRRYGELILDYTRGARVARRDFRVENVQKTVAGDVNLTLRERINL